MVSSYLPYPLLSGGQVRLYNLLKELKEKGHKVTLVCEKRDYEGEDDIDQVRKVCQDVFVVKRRKQWSIGNIIKAASSQKPFLIVGHTNSDMKRIIKDLLDKEKFDLIHVETFYVFQNLPSTDIPVVLVEHNIEHLVYKRYTQKAPLILRPLLYYDVAKIKKMEEKFWKKATKLVAVSNIEKSQMNRDDVYVVPNGVDTEKFNFKREKSTDNLILFIGDFKWIQNRDSVSWIIKNVWPKIEEKIKKDKLVATLWIVGKRIPENLKSLKRNGIVFDENAPVETERIFQKAFALLAPIRIGGGTSFKILESMSTGLPVLTTNLGNEGIGAKPGFDLIIADDEDSFANSLMNLLEDKKYYDEVSKNARKFIEENYDWKSISIKLENVYKEAVRT